MILDFFQGLWFVLSHPVAFFTYAVAAVLGLGYFHTELSSWYRIWYHYVLAVVAYGYLGFLVAWGLITIGAGIAP